MAFSDFKNIAEVQKKYHIKYHRVLLNSTSIPPISPVAIHV
jgi:hypothetical protein